MAPLWPSRARTPSRRYRLRFGARARPDASTPDATPCRGRDRDHAGVRNSDAITNPFPPDHRFVADRAGTLFTAMLGASAREWVGIAYLDRRPHLLATGRSDAGTPGGTALPARAIVRGALACRARALIVAHNHPSGDPTPSQADIRATRSLAALAVALNLILLDHIVVAQEGWTSFRMMGLL